MTTITWTTLISTHDDKKNKHFNSQLIVNSVVFLSVCGKHRTQSMVATNFVTVVYPSTGDLCYCFLAFFKVLIGIFVYKNEPSQSDLYFFVHDIRHVDLISVLFCGFFSQFR